MKAFYDKTNGTLELVFHADAFMDGIETIALTPNVTLRRQGQEVVSIAFDQPDLLFNRLYHPLVSLTPRPAREETDTLLRKLGLNAGERRLVYDPTGTMPMPPAAWRSNRWRRLGNATARIFMLAAVLAIGVCIAGWVVQL